MRRHLLDAFSHQDLPFEKLVAELETPRDLSRSPIFQAFFGLQAVAGEGAAWGEARLWPSEVPMGRAQFDLTWTAVDGGGLAQRLFRIRQRPFRSSDGRRLGPAAAAAFRSGGRGSAAAGGRDRPAAARGSRLGRGIRCHRPRFRPRRAGLTLRIAENARRHPDKVALGVEGEAAFTYGELDAAAESLAARLRSAGVGPETVVGISIGRLPSLVVAQLAVWKAGGAYLPLDPVYPAERLAFMLEDSGARLLLVDSRGEAAPPELLAKAAVIDLAEVGEERARPAFPRRTATRSPTCSTPPARPASPRE